MQKALALAEKIDNDFVCSSAGQIDSGKDLDYGGVVLAAIPCGRSSQKHLERGWSERQRERRLLAGLEYDSQILDENVYS